MQQINKFIRLVVIMFAVSMTTLFTTSCKKDQPNNPSNGTYDVSFNINNINPNGLKATNSEPSPNLIELVYGTPAT